MNWAINGYELPSGMVTYMSPVDETKWGPHCYPIIKTGCTSYENYKQNWLDKYIAKGDANASITEYNSHTVNGYTYYWFEGSYKDKLLLTRLSKKVERPGITLQILLICQVLKL